MCSIPISSFAALTVGKFLRTRDVQSRTGVSASAWRKARWRRHCDCKAAFGLWIAGRHPIPVPHTEIPESVRAESVQRTIGGSYAVNSTAAARLLPPPRLLSPRFPRRVTCFSNPRLLLACSQLINTWQHLEWASIRSRANSLTATKKYCLSLGCHKIF